MGYDRGMKFRLGLVIGFAAGYYLGSAAGRERHEQINRALEHLRRTDALELATEKAKAVVDLTVERARDIVDLRHPEHSRESSQNTPPASGPPGGNGGESAYSSSR